jgi:hypothetical protein
MLYQKNVTIMKDKIMQRENFNFRTKTYLNLYINKYSTSYRTMFTFKKLINKGPKLLSHFNQKTNFSTQIPHTANNIEETRLDLALAMTKYFETIFSPTPNEVLLKLENIKNGLFMYKMMTFAKTVPNPFLAKKFFQISYEKNLLIFPKKTVVEFARMSSKNPISNVLQLEYPQEKTSTSGVYEVHTGDLFSSQSSNVHIITFKTENPNNVNPDTQRKSLSMTGQKNCDLEVTFKTKMGTMFNSLLDILIGKNSHHKGNLIQTNINNNLLKIQANLDNVWEELDYIANNTQFSPSDKKIVGSIKKQIDSIYYCNSITVQNKTLLIQEQLVEIIPVVRKYDNKYNPNFLVFFEEQNKENENLPDIARRIQNIFPESITMHSPNEVMEETFKKAIPIFIEHYHIDWKLLSPGDREHCLILIKKFTPELYLEIINKF